MTLQQQALELLKSGKSVTPKQLAKYLYNSSDFYDRDAVFAIVSNLRKKGYDISKRVYRLKGKK